MIKKEPINYLEDFAAITRFPSPFLPQNLTNEEKINLIAEKFKGIMEVLGLDLNDDSLARTPYRVAKMYVEEVFSGIDTSNFPRMSFIEDKYQHNQRSSMVFVKTPFCSFCEHHFVPMNGVVSAAYVPNGKLIGLSKIPRIIHFFSKRPQVQERLSAQIADALSLVLDTESVAVSITAQHYCMIARGIEKDSSHAVTNLLRGEFDSNEALRNEFFDAIIREKGMK